MEFCYKGCLLIFNFFTFSRAFFLSFYFFKGFIYDFWVVVVLLTLNISPDDTGETVYARSSRNRLQTKIFIYSRYDVICTVCPWQILVGNWLWLSDPRFLYGSPMCMYVGYGRYSLLTSRHVLGRILELYQGPKCSKEKNISGCKVCCWVKCVK